MEAIFGLHNSPDLPNGAFGTRTGALTAGVDRFEITVQGVGAHAATPEKGVDTIVTAAQIITMLQTVVSRLNNTQEPVVLSVTRINGASPGMSCRRRWSWKVQYVPITKRSAAASRPK